MKVEVVYALPNQQILKTLELPSGATALDAVKQSGLAKTFDLGDVEQLSLGIFSRKIDAAQVLREGDRVEIYRSLLINPMKKRRMRAKNKA